MLFLVGTDQILGLLATEVAIRCIHPALGVRDNAQDQSPQIHSLIRVPDAFGRFHDSSWWTRSGWVIGRMPGLHASYLERRRPAIRLQGNRRMASRLPQARFGISKPLAL